MLTTTPDISAPWGVSVYLDRTWGLFVWFPDGGWAWYSSRNPDFFSEHEGLAHPHQCWQQFCAWITLPKNWREVRQAVSSLGAIPQRPRSFEKQMELSA